MAQGTRLARAVLLIILASLLLTGCSGLDDLRVVNNYPFAIVLRHKDGGYFAVPARTTLTFQVGGGYKGEILNDFTVEDGHRKVLETLSQYSTHVEQQSKNSFNGSKVWVVTLGPPSAPKAETPAGQVRQFSIGWIVADAALLVWLIAWLLNLLGLSCESIKLAKVSHFRSPDEELDAVKGAKIQTKAVFNHLVPFNTPLILKGQFRFDVLLRPPYIILPVYAVLGVEIPVECGFDWGKSQLPDEIRTAYKTMDEKLGKSIDTKLSASLTFEGVVRKNNSLRRLLSSEYPLYEVSVEKIISIKNLTVTEMKM